MTVEQHKRLEQDLAAITDQLSEISDLLRAACGDDALEVRRAEEAGAALQRLVWALEPQAGTAAMEAKA